MSSQWDKSFTTVGCVIIDNHTIYQGNPITFDSKGRLLTWLMCMVGNEPGLANTTMSLQKPQAMYVIRRTVQDKLSVDQMHGICQWCDL